MTQPVLKILAAAVLLAAAGSATAQEKLRFNPGEGYVFTPRYETHTATNPAEGQCVLRVWVDDRATVLLRGNEIGVRTQSGKQARDEGSYCSSPLPTAVENFHIEHSNAPAGGRVTNLTPPNPRNGYTGSVSIDDPRDGGRVYVLDVRWLDANYRPVAPRVAVNPGYGVYERFDEEAACQARVRSEIKARNRGNVDVEFRANVRKEQLGSGRERIRGAGIAERRDDSTRFGYECIVDDRNNRVVSANYEVRGQGDTNIR